MDILKRRRLLLKLAEIALQIKLDCCQIIIIVGGGKVRKVETIDELKEEINKYKVGDIVKFTVWRDGKEFRSSRIKPQQLDG